MKSPNHKGYTMYTTIISYGTLILNFLFETKCETSQSTSRKKFS